MTSETAIKAKAKATPRPREIVICRVWLPDLDLPPAKRRAVDLWRDGIIFFPEEATEVIRWHLCESWMPSEGYSSADYGACAGGGWDRKTRPATATETRKLLTWYRKHWAGLPPDCGPCPILEVRQKETSAMREKRRAMFNSR